MALRNNSNPMAGKPAGNFVYRRFKLYFPSTADETTRTRVPVDGLARICRILNFRILLKWYFLVSREAERGTRGLCLQVDDATADGDRDRLGTIAGAQLLHNMLDVNLDRAFGDEETVGDVAVAIALRNML